jgi:beta-glucosidase
MIGRYLPDVDLYVTENGASVPDDEVRRDYIDRHLAVALEARREGLAVEGYFAWTLMDNIEWALGWTRPFGLIEVDPATGTRSPRPSAEHLRARLAARR